MREAISRAGSSDLLASFICVDIDDAGDPQYFGFITANGAWMIKRLLGGTSIRVALGVDNYDSAWAARASQSYFKPNEA